MSEGELQRLQRRELAASGIVVRDIMPKGDEFDYSHSVLEVSKDLQTRDT